jgi:hypothetical protein
MTFLKRRTGVAAAIVLTTALLGSSFAAQPAFAAVPALTSISATSGPAAGGQMVTISGTGLTGVTVIMFGSVAATNVTVVNATTITCTTPAEAAGPAVSVTTPDGTSSVTYAYTVAANSATWGGYKQVGTAGTYTAVQANITVPTVNTTVKNQLQDSSGWVGIGGALGTKNELAQTGITAQNDKGKAVYYGWWDLESNITGTGEKKFADFAVAPGNVVTATVTQAGANLWKMSLTNTSTGEAASITKKFTDSGDSAELIFEVLPGKVLAPTTNYVFGAASRTTAAATSVFFNIPAGATLTDNTLVNGGGAAIATSSLPATNNGGFQVQDGAAVPCQPGTPGCVAATLPR